MQLQDVVAAGRREHIAMPRLSLGTAARLSETPDRTARVRQGIRSRSVAMVTALWIALAQGLGVLAAQSVAAGSVAAQTATVAEQLAAGDKATDARQPREALTHYEAALQLAPAIPPRCGRHPAPPSTSERYSRMRSSVKQRLRKQPVMRAERWKRIQTMRKPTSPWRVHWVALR